MTPFRSLATSLLLGTLLCATPSPALVARRTPSVPTPQPMTTSRLCEAYGRYAAMADRLRDQGVSSGAMIDYLANQAKAIRGTDARLTQAGEDRMLGHLTAVVLTVYASPAMTADQAKLAVYMSCLEEHQD